MNVVVGKSVSNRTPIFLEEMEYVVFRPYWNPPPGIVTKEIVPHARRDPSYLERENLEIVATGDDDARALPATGANLDAVAAGRLFVEAAMQGKRPTRVNLRQPLRVVIFYDTVHVNSEGIVHFVGDIYGHDRALDEALARGYP